MEDAQTYRDKVIELLATEKLPVADLPETLDNFIVDLFDGDIVGVAGIEIYACYGLLRSVAVKAEKRSLGIAGKLINRIEGMSRLKGLQALYLLTETAPAYFERKGFTKIARAEVPAEVQRSSEFSHFCPVSAIVMKKEL